MGADLSTLFCDFLEFISCAFFVQLDNLFEPIRNCLLYTSIASRVADGGKQQLLPVKGLAVGVQEK